MFTTDTLENLGQAALTEIKEKQEAALKKWLGVETVEEAIEKIEDLRCQGLKVEISATPLEWVSVGDHKDFKYSAKQTLRFKIVSLKDSDG